VIPVWSRRLAVLLAAGVLAYLVDLGGSSIWDANEAYYVETPREMLESGDYVNPTFNYEPRVNKPALSYWIVAALYHLFGVSVAVQRVAITLGALLMIAAAYLLARVASRDPLAPLLAAAGLAANPRFFMFARRIMIDVTLAALMTLALLCFALSERYPERRRWLLLGMYTAVGFGVLAKGPVAVVLPGLVFALYLAAHRELHRVRSMMLPAGALVVLAIVAPWYVALYMESGWTNITGFFIGENLDRFTELVGPQQRGALFYLPVVFSDGLPWSLLLPAAVALWLRERRPIPADPSARVRTLLFLWIATVVTFFSVSQTKQDLYILPIVVAVAVLGGDAAARGMRTAHGVERRWLAATAVVAGLVLAMLGAGVLHVFGRAAAVYDLQGARLLGGLVLAGGVAVAMLAALRRAAAATMVLLAVLVAVNWTMVLRVLPGFEVYKPVVPISEAIRQRARPDDLVIHYDVALPSMVYYLRRHIEITFAPEPFLELMRSGRDGSRDVYAVLPADRYRDLRRQLQSTCEVARRATFDAKLREMVSGAPPPAVVLITTRC
jgi:4-amino-4-deoxy-L-arabinose transferase-like glycosyltransferase